MLERHITPVLKALLKFGLLPILGLTFAGDLNGMTATLATTTANQPPDVTVPVYSLFIAFGVLALFIGLRDWRSHWFRSMVRGRNLKDYLLLLPVLVLPLSFIAVGVNALIRYGNSKPSVSYPASQRPIRNWLAFEYKNRVPYAGGAEELFTDQSVNIPLNSNKQGGVSVRLRPADLDTFDRALVLFTLDADSLNDQRTVAILVEHENGQYQLKSDDINVGAVNLTFDADGGIVLGIPYALLGKRDDHVINNGINRIGVGFHYNQNPPAEKNGAASFREIPSNEFGRLKYPAAIIGGILSLPFLAALHDGILSRGVSATLLPSFMQVTSETSAIVHVVIYLAMMLGLIVAFFALASDSRPRWQRAMAFMLGGIFMLGWTPLGDYLGDLTGIHVIENINRPRIKASTVEDVTALVLKEKVIDVGGAKGIRVTFPNDPAYVGMQPNIRLRDAVHQNPMFDTTRPAVGYVIKPGLDEYDFKLDNFPPTRTKVFVTFRLSSGFPIDPVRVEILRDSGESQSALPTSKTKKNVTATFLPITSRPDSNYRTFDERLGYTLSTASSQSMEVRVTPVSMAEFRDAEVALTFVTRGTLTNKEKMISINVRKNPDGLQTSMTELDPDNVSVHREGDVIVVRVSIAGMAAIVPGESWMDSLAVTTHYNRSLSLIEDGEVSVDKVDTVDLGKMGTHGNTVDLSNVEKLRIIFPVGTQGTAVSLVMTKDGQRKVVPMGAIQMDEDSHAPFVEFNISGLNMNPADLRGVVLGLETPNGGLVPYSSIQATKKHASAVVPGKSMLAGVMAGVGAAIAAAFGLSHLLVQAVSQATPAVPNFQHLTVSTAGFQPQSLGGFFMAAGLMTVFAFWRNTSTHQFALAQAARIRPQIAALVRTNPLTNLVANVRGVFSSRLTELPLSVRAQKRFDETLGAFGTQAMNGSA